MQRSMGRVRREWRDQLSRYGAALALVAASTAAAEALYRLTATTRLSMVFLAGVLLAAFLLGSGPAYFAAAVAFLVYNFYLVEPRFTIELTTPEELLTLLVFLAVAMLTGNLTGRVRDEAARAQARARATTALFDATREFSASSDEGLIRQRLAEHLAATAGGEGFVRDAGRLQMAPAGLRREDIPGGLPGAAEPAGGWTLRRLEVEGQALGTAGWRAPPDRRLSRDEHDLLELMCDAGAAAIARARLAAGKAEAEARARTEDLRNALLSSISHDLRTPLAAILASATSLREFGDSFDPGVRRDLAATIQEETERLDAVVANLLSMTRLQAGALAIQKAPFNVPEVVRRTVERRDRAHRRFTLTSITPRLPEGLGDPILFEQALGNVVENALRHTPEDTLVLVSTRLEDDRIVVDVCDRGPGVGEADLERIFDRFYRAGGARQTPGTGLGLSIARGLMEAMDGAIEARNDPAAGGLVVSLSLESAA